MSDAAERRPEVSEVYVPRPQSSTDLPGATPRGGSLPPVWPPAPYAPTTTPRAGTSRRDEELARPLQEESDDAPGEFDRSLVPLDAPRVRDRIFERLEDEIRSHVPDVLVRAADDPAGLATVIADRTGLPLLTGAPDAAGAGRDDLEGRRAAIVGETIRATPTADLVRSLEQRSASVVAIVAVAARNGDEMSMLSHHYNVFYIIPLE